MNPSNLDLVTQGNAQAEQREMNLLNEGTSQPTNGNASPGSTTQQAQDVLNQQKALSTPQQHQALTGPQPNLLERLLPTIGGIGGGILAGALDLGTGGLAIPLSAAIAGGGSALGKFGENALTHEQDLGKGVLASGVEGAAGQAGGELVGAALGKGGNLLKGVAEDKLAAQAAGAADKGATQSAIDAATNYKNNYGGISDRLQRDLKLGTNGKFVDSMGGEGSNPYHMQETSKGGLELNNVYDAALQKAPDVNMADFQNQVYKTMQKTGATDLSATPLGKAMADFGLQPNATLPETMPATEVRQLQQAVGTQMGNQQKLINNSELNGVANTEAESNYSTLKGVYDNLGSRIKTPEVDQTIAESTIDDAGRADLVAKYGDQHGNHIADTINDATSANDLLKPMQSYKQMDTASGMAINDIENAPGTARALARTKADIPVDNSAPAQKGNLLSPENVVNAGSMLEGTVGHHPLALLAPMVMKAAQNPAMLNGAGSILTKIGASAAPAVAGQIVGNSPNDVVAPGDNSGSISLNQGSSMNGMNPNEAAVLAALAQYGNGGSAQLGGAIQNLQKVNEAQAAEQQLANNFNTAGGAQGPIGGILNRLGATFTGGEAGSYGAQAQQAAQVIGNAFGIAPEKIATPQLTQNKTAAQASLGNIQSLIQSLLNPAGQQTGVVAAAQ